MSSRSSDSTPARSIGERLKRRPSAFHALQHREFRLLWMGLTVSAVGTWMQIVAQSLLVLKLTHGSAAALGTVSLAQALSFLIFSAVGGNTADRYNRRRLLMLTQSLMMGLAALLGVLTATGLVRFWMIPLVAFASGAVLSFDQPARNVLVATLVPTKHLVNALSLQSAVFNGAATVGPVLAGLTVSWIGYAGNFLLNAASYLAVLVALWAIRTPASEEVAKLSGGLMSSVREAFHYVRKDAVLPSVLWAYGALLFFGPSAALMLPVFATMVLRTGPAQLGILFSAVGAGTVIGALAVASLGDVRYKGRLLFASVLAWAVTLAAFGLNNSLGISILELLALGAALSIAGTMMVTLLQTRVPPEMRGRAMGLNTLLIMCVRPLGDFPAGGAITVFGVRPVILFGAGVVGAVSLALFIVRPSVRKI
jgi:MFS family permease